MSPGRWGAADCRGDRPVAGWRCLRPAVPSRWKLRSLSAPLFISVPPTPPCHLSLALSLSYCVTVLQRRIRSDTAWLALAVNTALRHANTHTTQLKQFVLLSINTHYHALLCGCDKCFLVYRGPASQPLMPAMETIHRGTAVGPKCSLPPIVQPLHFFINSKSKKKKKKSNKWPFRTNTQSQQLQAESRAAWKEALCHSRQQFLVYYAASISL